MHPVNPVPNLSVPAPVISSSNISAISDNSCYICADIIPDYVLKMFCDSEVNPTCPRCFSEFEDIKNNDKVDIFLSDKSQNDSELLENNSLIATRTTRPP